MEAVGWTCGRAEKAARKADAAAARKALAGGALAGRMDPRSQIELSRVLEDPKLAAGRIHVAADRDEAIQWTAQFILNANMRLLRGSWNGKAAGLEEAASGRARAMMEDMESKGLSATTIMDMRGGRGGAKKREWRDRQRHFLLVASGIPGLEPSRRAPEARLAVGTFFAPGANSMQTAREEIERAVEFLTGGAAGRWIRIHDSGHAAALEAAGWFDALNRSACRTLGDEACTSDPVARRNVITTATRSVAVVNRSRAWLEGVPFSWRARVDFMVDSFAWEKVASRRNNAEALAAHELLGHVGAESSMTARNFEALGDHVREWRRNPQCEVTRRFAASEEEGGFDAKSKFARGTQEVISRFMEAAANVGTETGDFDYAPDFHGSMGRLVLGERFTPKDALDIARGGLRRALAREDEFGIMMKYGERP